MVRNARRYVQIDDVPACQRGGFFSQVSPRNDRAVVGQHDGRVLEGAEAGNAGQLGLVEGEG